MHRIRTLFIRSALAGVVLSATLWTSGAHQTLAQNQSADRASKAEGGDATLVVQSTCIAQGRTLADEAMTRELRCGDMKVETERAVVWGSAASLDAEELGKFAQRATQGIRDIETYIGESFGSKKIEYFLHSDAGASHTAFDKPYIYIMPARVKERTAPYLHETVHVIAGWSEGKALWIQEGFATYVQTVVTKKFGGDDPNPLDPENKSAEEYFGSPAAKAVLPLIGLNGMPGKLGKEQSKAFAPIFEDRENRAAPFYKLSASFVGYLIEGMGLDPFKRICRQENIEAGTQMVTGRPLKEWKADWIAHLMR